MIPGRRLAILGLALFIGVAVPGRGQSRERSATQSDQACPDATDTPPLLDYYIGFAYRAHAADPGHRLPARCLVVAVARSPAAYSDSTIDKTLVLTEELLKRQPDEPLLLEAKLAFLPRLKRYREVKTVFDRLVAADSGRGTVDRFRAAIASAQRDADTASMLRYLAIATARYPGASQLAAEYRALRQVGRLRALVDTVHRAMKTDRRWTGGYATLASIYGELEKPDSVLSYIRRGRAAGASRQELATSMRSLIGGLIRYAEIQEAPDAWEASLPIAFDVDSLLSEPESKYLVALSIARVLSVRVDTINFYLPPVKLGPGRGSFESIDVTRVPKSRDDSACPSIETVLRLVAYANERLASGGDRFAPPTVPAIVDALSTIRARVTPLQRGCAGGFTTASLALHP